MTKTVFTALALVGFGITGTQAALITGDFSAGISSTTQAWLDLDDSVLDNGWYSNDATFVSALGVATVDSEEGFGSMVSQVFTNSQSGDVTLSFDYTPAAGHSVNYYVAGWNGTDLTGSANGRVAYINTAFSNNGPAFPNNGSVDLVGGTATGDTTTSTFDISGYNQIALVFWQDQAAGSGIGSTIGNVSIDVIPEPSSAALLGLAGCGLLLRRRR